MIEIDAMIKYKSSQQFELCYYEVSSSCGLTSFDSSHTNTHISTVDHIDVIGSISYC